MQSALYTSATVMPGGKIELADLHLHDGELVEVIILRKAASATDRLSAVDILAQAPGHLLFRTAPEVEAFLDEERDAWERKAYLTTV